ncbi:homeobox domain-containing protein [Mucor lusitanicus]|uniref:Homeobox domain-containing protein n=1 Tax=Mucor circinelloides f. lusitanicus TaxID=29924 RepID=A0A8H4BJ48_MUCCL|nr:homeobox domain-containing protein [Mucor lusitanicus]
MSNPDKKSPNLSHLDHSSEENVVNSNNKRLRIKSHEVVNKPKRKRITPYQLTVLSDLFASTDTPNYQLRENTASKLNMTNREVQVWFQNRRAKVNRNRLQEQKKHDPFMPFGEEHSTYDSQSSVTSSNSSTPTLYPQLSPQMRAIDILALAAEYVQRCDEEKRLTEERRKCWRPWD